MALSVRSVFDERPWLALTLAALCSPLGLLLVMFGLLAPVHSTPRLALGLQLFANVLVLCLLFGMLGIVLGVPILVLVRRLRRRALLALPVIAAGFALGYPLRQAYEHCLLLVTRRAEPLELALQRFRAEEGAFPAGLEQLVPKYLPAVPGTGLLGYPAFAYARHGAPGASAPCELRIELPLMADVPMLLYWPSGAYPARWDAREVERLERWAYVGD